MADSSQVTSVGLIVEQACGYVGVGPEVSFARREEATAFMVVDEAKYGEQAGVVTLRQEPGAVHLLNGLHDTELDRASEQLPPVAILSHGVQQAPSLATWHGKPRCDAMKSYHRKLRATCGVPEVWRAFEPGMTVTQNLPRPVTTTDAGSGVAPDTRWRVNQVVEEREGNR